MINREVYEKDPSLNKLLNQGVAKVTSGVETHELETLRYEITNFVCDGQYAKGLERILRSYLSNLDKPEQPGVWVSGFYGSGKSHLVKVLQYLWNDYEFPDGARSRGLAKVTESIKEQMVELSTQAKRKGGLHAAAGTLGSGAGDSVRLALLSILFRSVGLPSQFARASFLLWLRDEGLEKPVRNHVQAAGLDFDRELTNLYVSDGLAKAILAVRPQFADKPADVRMLLQKQFPNVTDISTDDMIEKVRQVFGGKKAKLPGLLIVLDEVQQYVGEKTERSMAVQDLQEQCCSRLGSNVLFVATGQNALSATSLLQRLQGRFPVTIELQDTDVERVTREIVLKKKPSAEPELKGLLDTHTGEIERHLSASKIAFNARDRSLLVQDYPLLPVRRRFWERVLRAVDKAGTGAQLRTQLWIVHDAVEKTADLDLGHVVNAAFIYDHIKSRVIQSGVLLQEIAETIAKQTEEEDGELRLQLCALIFLIGQLPHGGPNDAGIRANAETLADLMVTDLTRSSTELRKRVPELLEKLVASGTVLRVENEYRMQTREGSEWNQAYQAAMSKLQNDPGKLASERSQLLKTSCTEALKKRKLIHGESKEARSFELHFGAEPPTTKGASVPVWIRDGWEIEEKTVLSEARAAGDSTAVVYGFIPRQSAEELNRAIASYAAALSTIYSKGIPGTPEGIEAKRAMETQLERAKTTRDDLIEGLLNSTQIYIAADVDPVGGMLLETKVQDAAKACLDRLYKEFPKADHPDWHKVIERARKGDGDALEAVGHKDDPDKHPVCASILAYVGSGKKGSEVRKQFASPPFGWPQDAIDATLIVLTCAGRLQAKAGHDSLAGTKLDQKNLGNVEFRCEHIVLTTPELIQLRKVLNHVGSNVKPGQESQCAPGFLDRMKALGELAGGEPPLPRRPDLTHLSDLTQRVGNDQLKAILERKDQLVHEIKDWQKRAESIAERRPRWEALQALLEHAGTHPEAAAVRAETEAIEEHRGLLNDPDPVPGIVEALTHSLRSALNAAYARCQVLQQEGSSSLSASDTWSRLTAEDRDDLSRQYQLDHLPSIKVGSTDEVLATLGATKLQEWGTLSDAIPSRFSQALAAAAKRLEPKAQQVKLPSVTIKNEDDLKTWLATVEATIRARLNDGPVIV